VTYRDAGHILGSAMLELAITEEGKTSRIVFSGDLGRPEQLLMEDPTVISETDFLFIESTYGNRNHKDDKDSLDELAEAVAYSYGRGEKVIIPAFAVERTQEMIYCLHLLAKDGRLPADMPVYVDSPLAIQATEIFRKSRKYLDREANQLLAHGEDPLTLPQLRYTPSTQESMAINDLQGPAVVISARGWPTRDGSSTTSATTSGARGRASSLSASRPRGPRAGRSWTVPRRSGSSTRISPSRPRSSRSMAFPAMPGRTRSSTGWAISG
jgi:metallo-beta-lactamase family protein